MEIVIKIGFCVLNLSSLHLPSAKINIALYIIYIAVAYTLAMNN